MRNTTMSKVERKEDRKPRRMLIQIRCRSCRPMVALKMSKVIESGRIKARVPALHHNKFTKTCRSMTGSLESSIPSPTTTHQLKRAPKYLSLRSLLNSLLSHQRMVLIEDGFQMSRNQRSKFSKICRR